jgi:hypothetical protein
MGKQIQKLIRNHSLDVEQRNIGFGFIYFNNHENQLLKRLFVKNIKAMKASL